MTQARGGFAIQRLLVWARGWTVLATLLAAGIAVGPAWDAPGFARAQDANPTETPPPTRAEDVKETLHGVEVTDPFRWLEDGRATETRAWIDAQNAYTESRLHPLAGRQALRKLLTSLLKVESVGLPTERNGRYFFTKRLPEQDQPVLYLRKGLRGRDQVLIDPNPMSPDHTTSVDLESVSQDGKLLVYSIRQGGEDETTPHLFDVDARKDLPDKLSKANYFTISILPEKTGIYHARMTSAGPRVFFHKVGEHSAADKEVFGTEYGPDKIITITLSEDGRYLVFHVLHGAAADRTEVYVQDLRRQRAIVPIVNDLPARFLADAGGQQLFIFTNWKAANGRILAVDLSNPARDNWREVVPESDAVIENVDLAGGRLLVLFTPNAASQVKVFETSGRFVREIRLPAIGSVAESRGRWSSSEAFFRFESFHIPPTVYRYETAKGVQQVWSELRVPIDSRKFEVKQIWYTSKDGTKVPMFLTYLRGLQLDGSNPTLLTGYGGFNVSETPTYNARAAAWIMSGGLYALANLRGGGEFGEDWHRAGMRDKKQNVFDDFIAAAEWLIQNRYTRPSRLAIRGSSNGGLLVGAALTQRPELFAAVLCGYPLLDMLRYHKFLVARWWVPEYGSADDPQQFEYLYAYSPYHQVKPGSKYPAVLLITGDSDTRVDPLHARKMTARLQALASDHPVLLHYDTKAGHSAATPVRKQIDDLTDELSFAFWQLEVAPEPAR